MIQFMPRVCADFYDKNRNLKFRITREDLGNYVDAPDEIVQDPLYKMLLDEGSIKLAPENTREKRALENDPMAGADATGKDAKPKTESKTSAKTKAGSKTDSKAESKPVAEASDKTETVTEEKPAENPADCRTK